MMLDPASEAGRLLGEIRSLSTCDCTALDAATGSLSDGEKYFIASELTRTATHIATRVGSARGLPPPTTQRVAGPDSIDLSAQGTAVPVAVWFVRNTLHKWLWTDVLTDAELAAHELTAALVGAVEARQPLPPTRITLRLRPVSPARLVIEVHDSPENAHLVAEAERLISETVERISVRCGRHHNGRRAVLWSELARPELLRSQ
ncbi:hypothetical protein [Nocardia sp. BMG51109]|uniref:hypothetical protein n=1 Tax=Nocardia sp. BMG51109 TaxID=1056816 RepID=UPI00046435E3|nr:hypothetical protein [Nocardia sp. BMG51109]